MAHNVVTSHYISDAVRFPVAIRMYRRYEEVTHWETFVKKHFPDREIPYRKKDRARLHKEVEPVLLEDKEFCTLAEEFRTKISLAIDLIHDAITRQLPFHTVLMDSWFLSPDLVDMLTEKQKNWISLLKHNRKLEAASFSVRDKQGHILKFQGAHINVDDLVDVLPSTAYKPIPVGGKTYYCFTKSVRIPSLGPVRIVISFDNPELAGTYAVMVTNRRDWTAKKIVCKYLKRWPIETFYQDGKGHLGLAAYRMRTAEAIKKHWCLVFVAYALAHLDCLPTAPIAGTGTLPVHPIKTIGEVCRQQGQALIQALIMFVHNLLQAGESAQDVFTKLFAKQGVFGTS